MRSGTTFPCEVRMVRLPSSGRRLIRGSIMDITERKRMEVLAAGERRVFERITGHADLTADARGHQRDSREGHDRCDLHGLAVRCRSERAAARRGPAAAAAVPRRQPPLEIGPRNGSCAAAVFLQRQVIVAEIARDALWEHVRAPAMAAGLRACWSTPIRSSDGRMLGTVALYFRQPRSPLRRDFELMSRLTALAAIAIERKRSEEALRRSEAQYRSLFENVIEGVYRSTVDGKFEAVNPAFVQMLGYDSVDELLAVPRTSADLCAPRASASRSISTNCIATA